MCVLQGRNWSAFFPTPLLLEHLDIHCCNEIVLLKISSVLQQLSYLQVIGRENPQVVENNAPNLSRFLLVVTGKFIKLCLGEASQKAMKDFSLYRSRNAVSYALVKLPSIMPNLESLVLSSLSEVYRRVAID